MDIIYNCIVYMQCVSYYHYKSNPLGLNFAFSIIYGDVYYFNSF